jgi:hypothetical protein
MADSETTVWLDRATDTAHAERHCSSTSDGTRLRVRSARSRGYAPCDDCLNGEWPDK